MQNVKWKNQAILAAGLVVLFGGVVWLEYSHKPKKEAKEEQSKKLFAIKDTQVKQVVIHDGTGHIFEIRCSDATSTLCKPGENSKWEITQPIKLKADDSNANALISALNNLSVSESIDLKEETAEKRAALLKEYGLDGPARALTGTRRIEVTTPTGTTSLYLGLNHPIGESIFGVAGTEPGKADETKVYLVPTYFKANFDHDLTYWRDKKLVTVSAHEIERFKLKGPKGEVSGERKDGRWTLRAGMDTDLPGDIENIDGVLTAATFLTAKGFVADKREDAKAQAALKGAKAVATLEMQQEKGSAKEAPAPITLTLHQKGPAGKGGALYGTVSNLDPVYELEPNAMDRLNKGLADLRLSKLITSMERFTIKKIEIGGKPVGAPLVLKDADGKWTLDGSKDAVAGERVQLLLDKLSGNRIQEFLATAPAGEAEGLTLKLSDEKGALKRELAIWKSGGKLYARDLASLRKESFRLDPSIQDTLPWKRDYFDPKVAPPPPAGGPGAPVPPMPHGHGHGHDHGGEPGLGLPGAPPEPGKPLVPQPPKK